MGSSSFRFKQFEVWHDRCAQRVGTDGVLLGAWAKVEGRCHILDIGTGTGLIALMAAQREPKAHVVGVEIDSEAALQARENVSRSPFAERVEIVQSDVREYSAPQAFDCILCNPPFFTEDTLPPDAQRAMARNVALLGFEELIVSLDRLLYYRGTFNVILPATEVDAFVSLCFNNGLKNTRRCWVRTVVGKQPKRCLLEFSREGTIFRESEELVLQERDGTRTSVYQELARDFYL